MHLKWMILKYNKYASYRFIRLGTMSNINIVVWIIDVINNYLNTTFLNSIYNCYNRMALTS